MTLPVSILCEFSEASTAWEWLLTRVDSQMVIHSGLLLEDQPTSVAYQLCLKPVGNPVTLSDNMEGGLLRLIYFLGVFVRWKFLTLDCLCRRCSNTLNPLIPPNVLKSPNVCNTSANVLTTPKNRNIGCSIKLSKHLDCRFFLMHPFRGLGDSRNS